jgi:uroporphyrin-III C-methyltransferase/precorrin-2 dehydrogenase/sirohydrochlorin ferrochelatase
MDYLPIFLKLEDRLAVVVGGGDVAARKLELLRRAGARIRIVAPEAGEAVAALAASGRIAWRQARFGAEDLEGADLVIAATDARDVNEAVAAAARARHLPVNVVDSPDLCSFIMPAIIDRGRVVAAVSTGGASPVLARLVRARIELALPQGVERLAELAASWRDRVKAALPEGAPRRRFWERLFAPRSVDRILEGELPDLDALLAASGPLRGRLVSVEVPSHDPEALTLRAIRLLQSADLVLHEAGVPAEILEFARRDAKRVELARLGGSTPPEAAAALADGLLVVTLASARRAGRRGAARVERKRAFVQYRK